MTIFANFSLACLQGTHANFEEFEHYIGASTYGEKKVVFRQIICKYIFVNFFQIYFLAKARKLEIITIFIYKY